MLDIVTLSVPAAVCLLTAWSQDNHNVCGASKPEQRRVAQDLLAIFLKHVPETLTVSICSPDAKLLQGASSGAAHFGDAKFTKGQANLAEL